MFKTLIFSLLVCSFISCSEKDPRTTETDGKNGDITLWVTNAGQSKLLKLDTSASILPKQEYPQGITIEIEGSKQMQEMEGFGAALTESSAYLLLTKLNANQRQAIIKELFDNGEGIGISYLRITMGASDFSLENYTYCDVENDVELKNFSIEKDKKYLIPVLKEILAVSPKLKIMATPWSAPAWMKTSGKLAGGKLKEQYYDAYANYFIKFLNAYEAEGIQVDAISVQNEPLHEAAYPSMRMESEEQGDFIKNHLGPLFAKENIKSKILLYDHNWDRIDYPMAILADPEANKYISGSAFHAYGGEVSAMSLVNDAYKDKGIYFTEISGGAWATNFGDNLGWNMKNIFIGAPRNWAKNALLWNLALDENHGPQNKGCDNCRGVITITESGSIKRNVEYYAIGHLSKFVLPGAKRIETVQTNPVEQVVFKNPDGSIVTVVLNDTQETQKINIVVGESRVSYNQEPRSTVTAVLKL